MAQVETALRRETRHQVSATHTDAGTVSPVEDLDARAAEEALLHRRLRLLHLYIVLNEVGASADFERLSSVQQEIQEALDPDEETIWQIAPLWASFMLHSIIWQAGARLLPQLLSAKERVAQSASHFAVIKIRQWLALAAVEAGQLRLASQESQAVLNLIEQRSLSWYGSGPINAPFVVAVAQAG
jgi:LuxR family maltose regulon positive regulatory protein